MRVCVGGGARIEGLGLSTRSASCRFVVDHLARRQDVSCETEGELRVEVEASGAADIIFLEGCPNKVDRASQGSSLDVIYWRDLEQRRAI